VSDPEAASIGGASFAVVSVSNPAVLPWRGKVLEPHVVTGSAYVVVVLTATTGRSKTGPPPERGMVLADCFRRRSPVRS